MEDASNSEPLAVGSLPTASGLVGAPSALHFPEEHPKRKADEVSRTLDSGTATASQVDARDRLQKRPKLDPRRGPLTPNQMFLAPQNRSSLPAEIWHHIFTSLPPRSLGNLLRINKLFNTYLDPCSPFASGTRPPRLSQSLVEFIEPNEIWKRARRAFWPKMPGPFQGMTELDMWKLACTPACQFCRKKDTCTQSRHSDPYQCGPGPDGVAIEMDLLLSTGGSFLMPALQFVFATSSHAIIPLRVIESGKLPPTDTLTKLFWAADVDALRKEFASVKEFGAATAEEWQKGLSSRGPKLRAEIAKWQKFDESGGVHSMRTLQCQQKPSKANAQGPATVQSAMSSQSKAPASVPEAVVGASVTVNNARDATLPQVAKAARNTGVVPAVPREATDKPRPSASSAEKAAPKTRAELDAEWDEIQGPVRRDILKYADEAIHGDWDDGEKVTNGNAPAFAADVLLHVQMRFNAEVKKKAQAAREAGQQPVVDPPQGPFTQKLSLENMKYVFDVKVKPITGNFRTELFLCNDCAYNGKFYGFEGVVQHFAAKHTTLLSQGPVVVNWRAEWPLHSPFKVNTRPPKNKAPLVLPSKPPASRNAKLPVAQHQNDLNQSGPSPLSEQPQPSHPVPPTPAPVSGPVVFDNAVSIFRIKKKAIGQRSRELWEATADMHELPPDVRLHAFLYSLNAFFNERYKEPLSLSIFLDSLRQHHVTEMKPLWTTKFRLPCKACEPPDGQKPGTVKKEYFFKDLLKHFSDKHVSAKNWLTDMLSLPSYHALRRMAEGAFVRTKFPMLLASIKDLPQTITEAQLRRQRLLDRAERRASCHPTQCSAPARDAGQPKNGRRQRELSALVKREHSPVPVLANPQRVPAHPKHTASASAVTPKAEKPDIRGPAQDSWDSRGPMQRGGHPPDGPREARDPPHDDVQQRRRVPPVERFQPVPPSGRPSALYVAAWQEQNAQPVPPYVPQSAPVETAREQEHGIGPPQYAHAPPRREYRDRFGEEDGRAAPPRVEYAPYEEYEVVRVVHPDGDYLVRRPIRWEVVAPPVEAYSGRPYYGTVVPQMYEETTGGPRLVRGYYGVPAVQARAWPVAYEAFDEAAVYSRPGPPGEAGVRDFFEHGAATAAQLPSAYHEEYDPHYPMATSGRQPQPAAGDDDSQQPRQQWGGQ